MMLTKSLRFRFPAMVAVVCLLLTSVVRGSAAVPLVDKSVTSKLEKSVTSTVAVPGSTRLISENYAHTGTGNSATIAYVVSANERYVAFSSSASNLITNDLNGTWADIFRLDRETGQLDLVTVNHSGSGSANFPSLEPLISADGRYVAFTSAATDLVASGGGLGVYIRDMEAGQTTAVSVDGQGIVRAGNSLALSADGRYVAFTSGVVNLLPGFPISNRKNLYVRDTWASVTKLVSVNRSNTADGNGTSGYSQDSLPAVSLSSDGRYLAFLSDATDLVQSAIAPGVNLFVRDLALDTTSVVNSNFPEGVVLRNPRPPVISANGRYLAYAATPIYQAPAANCVQSIIVYDLQTSTNTIVSRNRDGAGCGNSLSLEPAISADGRFVAFTSFATDLVPAGDTNNSYDIYVRDLQLGVTRLVSANRWATNGGNGNSTAPSISADGRFVSFTTFATDLTATLDKNAQQDVVLRDQQSGSSRLVSAAGPTRAGNSASLQSWVSSNGEFVIFCSSASDLLGVDENGAQDLYLNESETPARP